MARTLSALPIGLGIFALGCGGVRYTESFAPDEAVDSVRVRVDAGTISFSAGEHLRVERDIRAPEGVLDLRHRVVDGVLELDAHCPPVLPCAVDTRISLPAGTPVAVELASGEVWATGVGSVDIALGQGLVDVEATGPVEIKVARGQVRATLGEGAQAHVAVGDGDIEVQVPSGPWHIEATAAQVDADGIEPDPLAFGRLELTAPSGAIRVRGGDKVAQR